MEQELCKLCGKVIDKDFTNCGQSEIMEKEHCCFTCATWIIHNKNYDDNVFIYRANNILCRTSVSGRYLVNPATNLGFKSFGGRHIYIQMLSNGEVFETNNLWFQGEIPKNMEHLEHLQENCRFIKEDEYFEILRKQGLGKVLYSNDNQHIGQVRLENSLKEINRLNSQELEITNPNKNIVWRRDFSEYHFVIDEIDFGLNNPCKLHEGYCWIVSVPTYAVINKVNDTIIFEGDRFDCYEKLNFLNQYKEFKKQLKNNIYEVIKNQRNEKLSKY